MHHNVRVIALSTSGQLATHPFVFDLAAIAIALGIVIGIAALTFLLSRLAAHRLAHTLQRAGFQVNVAILLTRTLRTLIWILGILSLLYLFGIGLTPIAAVIGVLGLAASLSLQSVLQNLVAGVYLLAERPFAIGDFILVSAGGGLNHEGVVEDIQMRTTNLRSRDNELILVPNSCVFSGVVTNRTAVGGAVTQVCATFPRDTSVEHAGQEGCRVLASLPAVLAHPSPQFRVEKATPKTWTGTFVLWSRSNDARSDAVHTLAQAFPEADVEIGERVP